MTDATVSPGASRRFSWLRDEGLLALDLYFTEGPRVPVASVRALSEILRSIPIESQLGADPTFRSPASVSTKLANFRALDDTIAGGLEHVSGQDTALWAEFSGDRLRLHEIADGIRAAIAAPAEVEIVDLEDADSVDAQEGTILTRVHRARERNRRIVRLKKQRVLDSEGQLACEACGFDFASRYGTLGKELIECHHTRPVSELSPSDRTRLSDLAVVCANCHRMLHRRRPWLTLEELRSVLAEAKG